MDGTDDWNECFVVDNINLPTGYYMGFTAATGELADNHDIISVRVFDVDKEAGGGEEVRQGKGRGGGGEGEGRGRGGGEGGGGEREGEGRGRGRGEDSIMHWLCCCWCGLAGLGHRESGCQISRSSQT